MYNYKKDLEDFDNSLLVGKDKRIDCDHLRYMFLEPPMFPKGRIDPDYKGSPTWVRVLILSVLILMGVAMGLAVYFD